MKQEWFSQDQIDEKMRQRISAELSRSIAAYDGSPVAAKEILRGLAAAKMMDLDMGPFEDALSERHRSLDAA